MVKERKTQKLVNSGSKGKNVIKDGELESF